MITIALLEKLAPINLPDIFALLLDIGPTDRAELNVFHPALGLVQSIVDVLDPIQRLVNFARAHRLRRRRAAAAR